MDALMALFKGILDNQPLFQVFVGGSTFLLIAWMVTRGRNDKEALPPPAPGTISDPPMMPFAQGPAMLLDILREQRDMDRRRTEDSTHIRECVRIIREEVKKHTEILDEIRDDQRLEHRLNSERHHRHP
jgi:hypothetical protein